MPEQGPSKKVTHSEGDRLARRLLASVKRAGALRPGERVGVGVSGGADSVALLLLLLDLREELGIVLSVAHVNHKLRGKASEVDERFVAKLAEKYGLEFLAEGVDVAGRAKREKANLEDMARRARYEFFAKLVGEGKVDRVAVGHTADDQAETVLGHILRGTGVAGLGGIHPKTEWAVRPLLSTRRAELRKYVRAKKQTWREDTSNQDTTRMRARIRKKLLPLLEREFQSRTVEHLVSLAELAREDEEFMDALARQLCEELVRTTGDETRIVIRDLLEPLERKSFHANDLDVTAGKEVRERAPALTKRILRRLIELKKCGTAQISGQHIAAVMELARHGASGKLVQLPAGVEVRRGRDELIICTKARPSERQSRGKQQAKGPGGTANFSGREYQYKIAIESGDVRLRVAEAGCVIRLRVIDWPAQREETTKSGAVLDRDRLQEPLVLRNWRFGDRLRPAGHHKAHKLKRLLYEKRVSRWERAGWPVLASGGELAWARGFPVAAAFAPGEGTRTGILITEEKS